MHLGRWASFTGPIAKISFLGLLVSALSAQVGEVRLRGGFPEDWTHHRIKFNTATLHQHPEIAAHEPRAAIQLYREAAARFSPNLTTFSKPEFTPTRPHADWSYNLGTAVRVQAGRSFRRNGTPIHCYPLRTQIARPTTCSTRSM